MNSALKAILWILVALVVIGGAYYWYQNRHPAANTAAEMLQTASTTQPAAVQTGPTLPSGTDTSDAALQQDLSDVDAQMSPMSADTASIDKGLSDTPVPQQ